MLPVAGRGGEDGRAEGVSESDAVGPQVSVFYETIKAGFYMKLLKNGLCFNSVWGQSLNLSHSPPDEKKNPHYNLWIMEAAVLVCFAFG